MITGIKTNDDLKKVFDSNTNTLIIVDFFADWCGPCNVLGEVIEDLSAERSDFILVKIDVEESDEIVSEYRIRNIPTLIFIKDNEILERNVGNISKENLIEKISKYA